MGKSSRREAEKWIQAGRISVNGQVVTELGTKIDPESDQVHLDGKPLRPEDAPPRVYWMLHKPDKVLTSREAQGDRETIYDLPRLSKLHFLVNPIGRLDFRTEGLLLLSNDGTFVHRLSHPSFKLPRLYQALVSKRLSDQELRQIKLGIELEDGPVSDVEIKYAHSEKRGNNRAYWYFVTVKEGRNRLVRRIFEHFDAEVVRLLRYGFGNLRLPEDLPPGEYRQLSKQDLKELRRAVGLV